MNIISIEYYIKLNIGLTSVLGSIRMILLEDWLLIGMPLDGVCWKAGFVILLKDCVMRIKSDFRWLSSVFILEVVLFNIESCCI